MIVSLENGNYEVNEAGIGAVRSALATYPDRMSAELISEDFEAGVRAGHYEDAGLGVMIIKIAAGVSGAVALED